jgi:two-component system, OmpR family, KDP operon response regulator KdpE
VIRHTVPSFTDRRRPAVMLVEDDGPLRTALAATLLLSDFAVREVSTGEDALAHAETEVPDLYLLDLSLPGMDGLEVLTRIRADSAVPVVVLTVRDGKRDKITALDAGADDYVVKPIDGDELVARVRAALRRRPASTAPTTKVRAGNVEFDGTRGELRVDDRVVHLTATELAFLDLLIRAEGGLVTHAQVEASLRSRRGTIDQRASRSLVAQLRKKLHDDASDPRFIVTHVGLGYRWVGADEA